MPKPPEIENGHRIFYIDVFYNKNGVEELVHRKDGPAIEAFVAEISVYYWYEMGRRKQPNLNRPPLRPNNAQTT